MGSPGGRAKDKTPCAFCGKNAAVAGGVVMGVRDGRFRIAECKKHVGFARALWTTYNALCGITVDVDL